MKKFLSYSGKTLATGGKEGSFPPTRGLEIIYDDMFWKENLAWFYEAI